jgi:UDPglucose 6-dehydrogenase
MLISHELKTTSVAPEITRLRICVIGAGYVGLVSAASFAEMGHSVTCLEINSGKLALLRSGRLPIFEDSLDDLVAEHMAHGRLDFSDDYAGVIPQAEVVFLAVDTPMAEDGSANLSSVFAATRSVLEFASRGLVLVIKSTVPAGTGDSIAALVQSERPDVQVVSNPEFLRQGSAVRDFLEPDRIVIGAGEDGATAAETVAMLYEGLEAPIIFCSRGSAELAKYASNAFLATRISFMNEIAAVCDAVGADIQDVAGIVGLDPRIGRRYLQAGLGWGGSCLPKDVSALRALASSFNMPMPMLEATAFVNENQRRRAIAKLSLSLGGLEDRTIGVLGLSFKAHTDDIRGAPAVATIRELSAAGARVRAHDPLAMGAVAEVLPEVHYCNDAYDAATGCHALLLATEWPDYFHLDWGRVRELMIGKHILDGRNVLDKGLLALLGFAYDSFGRAAPEVLLPQNDLALETA